MQYSVIRFFLISVVLIIVCWVLVKFVIDDPTLQKLLYAVCAIGIVIFAALTFGLL